MAARHGAGPVSYTHLTLGLAEDTWALNEGAIGEDAFLRQAELIQKEREAMFFSALERTRRGVVACVFDTTDRVQHMFHGRPEVIEPLYCDMDRIVGKTLAYADPDTALFILSDHGFCAFRRGVNLNSWLLREGYLSLDAGLTASGEYLEGIDWTKTRAYTFGLGGLYLNLRGREAHGILSKQEAAKLLDELVRKLTGLADEETGETAIQSVYRASDIYRGPYLNAAPDLIVGYAPGYRASWDAATGRVTSAIFEDNRKAWRGDHCVDPPQGENRLVVTPRIEQCQTALVSFLFRQLVFWIGRRIARRLFSARRVPQRTEHLSRVRRRFGRRLPLRRRVPGHQIFELRFH